MSSLGKGFAPTETFFISLKIWTYLLKKAEEQILSFDWPYCKERLRRKKQDKFI